MVSITIIHSQASHALPILTLPIRASHALLILALILLCMFPLMTVGVAHGRRPGGPRCEHSDAALHDAECARPLGDP